MAIISNTVYLVTQDLSKLQGTDMENKENVLNANIYRVLDYRVNTYRQRNQKGEPYRNNRFGRVWITIDSTENESNEFFYAALTSKTPISFTVIFGNREMREGKFQKYDNSIVLDGYVVNIEEQFEKFPNDDEGLQKLYIEFLASDSRCLNDKNA